MKIHFNNRRNRHLMVQPRQIPRWSELDLIRLATKWNLDDNVNNLILWLNSGKRNWIEFYVWLNVNGFEWKNRFFGSRYTGMDIGVYLDLINNEPKFSGFESYNNFNYLPTEMIR